MENLRKKRSELTKMKEMKSEERIDNLIKKVKQRIYDEEEDTEDTINKVLDNFLESKESEEEEPVKTIKRPPSKQRNRRKIRRSCIYRHLAKVKRKL